ncbi:MAG: hypothetical protein ACM3ML_17250 [Micromonosporaceae bacterium]
MSTKVHRVGGQRYAWPVPTGNPAKVYGHRTGLARRLAVMLAVAVTGMAMLAVPAFPAAAGADTVTEIHYSFGNTPSSV